MEKSVIAAPTGVVNRVVKKFCELKEGDLVFMVLRDGEGSMNQDFYGVEVWAVRPTSTEQIEIVWVAWNNDRTIQIAFGGQWVDPDSTVSTDSLRMFTTDRSLYEKWVKEAQDSLQASLMNPTEAVQELWEQTGTGIPKFLDVDEQ